MNALKNRIKSLKNFEITKKMQEIAPNAHFFCCFEGKSLFLHQQRVCQVQK